MPKPGPTILIVAGELSGDRLGGTLMAELKQQHPHAQFVGVGGPHMAAQGLKSVFPLSYLALMGLTEIVPHLPRLWRCQRQLLQLAREVQPTLVLTIDNQTFAATLAKKLSAQQRALGRPAVPHVHYVAPKVWAWRQGRVKKLRTIFTQLLTILPFEAPWFSAAGLPATYVGHPMVTTLAPFQQQAPGLAHQLALLPGSRGAELARHWPIMLATYRRLKQLSPQLTAVLVLPSAHAVAACRQHAGWHSADAITVVTGEARFAALASSKAALAKSGTNNLELALLNVPAVVMYRVAPLTALLLRWLLKVPHVSLPNLILNPPQPLQHKQPTKRPNGAVVYPEFLQQAATPANLARALLPLLTQAAPRAAQLKQLAKVQQAMATPQPPSQLAAAALRKYLK